MRALADHVAHTRLGGIGIAGTAILHVAVIGGLVFIGRGKTVRAALPAYRVELIAAPRASGTETPTAEGREPRANAPASKPNVPAPTPAPKPAATRQPPAVTPPAAVSRQPSAVSRQPSAVSHQPSAALPGPANGPPVASPNTGAAPGTGTAPATIRTEGVEFPFPGYLRNLVAQVYRRWHPPSDNADLEAEMLFFVHRDGTVTGLQFVKRSGSFAFDLEAQGAVESAARSGAFGPLPQGFGPELLPVSFFFSPRSLR